MSLLMKDRQETEDTSTRLSDRKGSLRSLSPVEVSDSLASTSEVAEAVVLATSNTNSLYEPPADYRLPTIAIAALNVKSLLDVQMIATVVQLSPIDDNSTTEGSNNK